VSCLDIYRVEYACEVSNSKGVEAHSYNHPDEGCYFLVDALSFDIAIPHCSEGLQGPVDRHQVLVGGNFITDTCSDDPVILVLIFKLGN